MSNMIPLNASLPASHVHTLAELLQRFTAPFVDRAIGMRRETNQSVLSSHS